jgi:ribosomal protein S18 acetylase RimI-like enzyme
MPFFRSAEEKDAPKLRRIWSRTFGDSEGAVQRFLDHFGIEIGVVGIEKGVITCAAFIIPTDGIRLLNGETKSCLYIYAVAVLHEFRGSGYGKELMKAAMRISRERGFAYTVLKPSDSGLFEFYRKLGFQNFAYANELRFLRSELKKPAVSSEISQVTPKEYSQIRENALKDFAHIKLSLKGIEFQGLLGELYSINIDGITGCASVEVYGVKCNIKELLIPKELIFEAVSLLAVKTRADKLRAVMPVFDESSSCPNGMIYPPLEASEKNAFLGLAYD